MDLLTFKNPKFADVHGYLDANNTAWLKVEGVVYGLGFTKNEEKLSPTGGRKTYTSIRWERVNAYLKEFGYSAEVGKDDFIPENMVYRLAMKANNEAAKKFQIWLADEVLPSIRKHGAYITPTTLDNLLNNPDFAIRLFTELKSERDKNSKLVQENAVLTQQVAELQPKVDYCDLILNCKDLIQTGKIAKDYGMSARAFNKLLHKLGVQFKQGDIWLLYQKYAKLGWTSTKTYYYSDNYGDNCSSILTCWTQKGRLGLYNLLKGNGYLPLIEQNNDGNLVY